MNIKQIEHLWKRVTNDPNHDTNWHDPVVVAFAEAVAAHTLINIDPSKFMSYQEGYEAGATAEREACAKVCEDLTFEEVQDAIEFAWVFADAIRARGQQ